MTSYTTNFQNQGLYSQTIFCLVRVPSSIEILRARGNSTDKFTSIITRANDTRDMDRVRSSHLIYFPITLLILDRQSWDQHSSGMLGSRNQTGTKDISCVA